jgi:cytochrome c oxidase subunit 2
VQHRSITSRRADARRLALASGITALIAIGAACGSESDTADPAASPVGTTATGDPVAAAVERGEQLSRSSGCAGCHGPDFGGGAGPTWLGLAGSEVTLTDGSTVVADEAYLTRAIADPSAELVEGYTLKMPANNLTDAEIADIVAFITTLDAEG